MFSCGQCSVFLIQDATIDAPNYVELTLGSRLAKNRKTRELRSPRLSRRSSLADRVFGPPLCRSAGDRSSKHATIRAGCSSERCFLSCRRAFLRDRNSFDFSRTSVTSIAVRDGYVDCSDDCSDSLG